MRQRRSPRGNFRGHLRFTPGGTMPVARAGCQDTSRLSAPPTVRIWPQHSFPQGWRGSTDLHHHACPIANRQKRCGSTWHSWKPQQKSRKSVHGPTARVNLAPQPQPNRSARRRAQPRARLLRPVDGWTRFPSGNSSITLEVRRLQSRPDSNCRVDSIGDCATLVLWTTTKASAARRYISQEPHGCVVRCAA